jgi:exosortase D (VPLPA-CTERM-specific)
MTLKEGFFNTVWFKACALLAVFIAAYWTPIRGTVNIWLTSDDYSYGFIIPIVSAYLIWDQRQRLIDVNIRGYWPVLPILIICVLLSLYAILGSSGNISRPLIPVLIILFTLFCFGKELTKRLIFPLSFLIFMVPIPAFLERTLGTYLKSVSSKLGGAMISSLGIPVHVSGNIIDLGVTQLQVVDACNGIRYLFPLIALGFIYAYFFERAPWKKVFCVMATIPIAVLTNGLRIGLTGLLTNLYGASAAEGFFHDFTGWSLFLVSFAFLFLLGRLLRFLPPKPGQIAIQADDIGTTSKGFIEDIKKPLIVSVAILLVVGALSVSTGSLPPIKLKGGIASFPLHFAGWRGEAEFVDPEIVEQSGAEESFSGNYLDANSHPVSLYIGFRSTAFLENENFFHSPTVCLPSSGWSVDRISTRRVSGVPAFPDLKVSEMVIENIGTRQLVYFWFQTKSRATDDKNMNRFHLAVHAIKRDNTYDLFIRPIMPILPNEKIEDAEKRMDQFVRDMMGAMIPFLKAKAVCLHQECHSKCIMLSDVAETYSQSEVNPFERLITWRLAA